jgi:hypothetical protein
MGCPKRIFPDDQLELIRDTLLTRLRTLSDKELARVTGVGIGTVRKHLRKERERLEAVRGRIQEDRFRLGVRPLVP